VAKVTVPTPVIHGDSDAVVPFEVSGRRSHELIAGSELVVEADRTASTPVTRRHARQHGALTAHHAQPHRHGAPPDGGLRST
jgi:pimeloyl-ACP methyl ester carboxylesterase